MARKKAHQYLVDEKGTRMGVLLDMDEYRKIMEALEELESIRAYDAAKTSAEKAIPFEEAVDNLH